MQIVNHILKNIPAWILIFFNMMVLTKFFIGQTMANFIIRVKSDLVTILKIWKIKRNFEITNYELGVK